MEQLTWKNVKIEWKLVLGYRFLKAFKQIHLENKKAKPIPSVKLRYKFGKIFIRFIL